MNSLLEKSKSNSHDSLDSLYPEKLTDEQIEIILKTVKEHKELYRKIKWLVYKTTTQEQDAKKNIVLYHLNEVMELIKHI